jgi:hypothetical protein
MTPDEIVRRLLEQSTHEVTEVEPGVYTHVFTPPEMTLQDVIELLNSIPTPDEDEE